MSNQRLILSLLLALLTTAALYEPCAAAGPEAELRQLHEKVLRAHREGNVEILLEDEADDYLIANRGEVSRPSIEQRRARLGPYLRATKFSEYRDLIDPIVTVSSDFTLGWVVVQVKARGVQKAASSEDQEVDFTSAWIELYGKRGGRWLRIGNVSNFKP